MWLLPVGVHILPVRYELVEIEVIVVLVWCGCDLWCDNPMVGKNGICFDVSGLPFCWSRSGCGNCLLWTCVVKLGG